MAMQTKLSSAQRGLGAQGSSAKQAGAFVLPKAPLRSSQPARSTRQVSLPAGRSVSLPPGPQPWPLAPPLALIGGELRPDTATPGLRDARPADGPLIPAVHRVGACCAAALRRSSAMLRRGPARPRPRPCRSTCWMRALTVRASGQEGAWIWSRRPGLHRVLRTILAATTVGAPCARKPFPRVIRLVGAGRISGTCP